MPGFVVHVGATVLCAHGGQAQPTAPNPRVLLGGAPSVTVAAPYAIAGCPMVTGGSPTPCVTGQWTLGATRVTSNGQPLVLVDSRATCVPNGTPLLVTATQTRVTAQ
ncbi:hypothetical protein [Intrasporangium sp.]|uniref:hypothetical protein n=1 Tax=Intrasporangium sp. TaxID=1925024 RepID=UPI003221E8BC